MSLDRDKTLTYIQKLKLPGNEEKYARYLESKRKYAKKKLSENPAYVRELVKVRKERMKSKKLQDVTNINKKFSRNAKGFQKACDKVKKKLYVVTKRSDVKSLQVVEQIAKEFQKKEAERLNEEEKIDEENEIVGEVAFEFPEGKETDKMKSIENFYKFGGSVRQFPGKKDTIKGKCSPLRFPLEFTKFRVPLSSSNFFQQLS